MPILLPASTPDFENALNSVLDQIQSLVSVSADEFNLSREKIKQDVFLGDANLKIQGLVSNWEQINSSGTEDAKLLLKIITMKQCAVNILAAYSRTRQDSTGELSESVVGLTPKEAIALYETDIAEGIKTLNPSETPISGTYITAAVVVDPSE